MGQVASYPMQGGQPSRNRDLARRGGVALPYGGPTDAGGDYAAMTPLSLVGGTAQPEIWTLTLGGSGTVVLQFGAQKIYAATALTTGTATAAQVLAALQTIFPAWMLPAGSVTGSAGGPFTITFGVNARIGGLINFVVTGTATGAVVRTQRGSCGAGQYDVTDGTTYTICSALLVDNISTGPSGDLDTVPYGPVTDSTFTPWAWIEGFFFAADAPLLTNAIVAASPKLSFYIGSAVTQGGAELRLLQ
jgi:hypothetical protein